MSFGFSPSDAITIYSIVAKAYRGWNGACGEYSDITLSLNEIRILLERIKDESESDGSVLVRSVRDATRLKGILAGVRRTAEELTTTIARFKSLGQDRSRESNWRRLQKNWHRYRFGSANISVMRSTLSQHVSAITAYLEAVGLSSLSRIEQDLHALPELMQQSMNTLAAEIRAGRREGSIMTAYEGDDSELWRQFRRELISDGIRGSDVHKFKPRIRRCLQHWMEEGFLEEQRPSTKVRVDVGGESDLNEAIVEVADNGSDSAASLQEDEARGIRKVTVDQEHRSSTSRWTITEDDTDFAPCDETVNGVATPHKSPSQIGSQDIVLSNAHTVQDYGLSTENMHSEDSLDYVANDTAHERVEDDVVQADGGKAWQLRLDRSRNPSGEPVFCTIFVVVPDGDLRSFCRLATNARPLLPFLIRWLPNTAIFQSSVVMGAETLVTNGTGEVVSVSHLEAKNQSLGLVNGARIWLSEDRMLFDNFRRGPPLSKTFDETDDNGSISVEWMLRRRGNGWYHNAYDYRRYREKALFEEISSWNLHSKQSSWENLEVISFGINASSNDFVWDYKGANEADFEETVRERLRQAAPKTGYAQLTKRHKEGVSYFLIRLARMGFEYGCEYRLLDIEQVNEGRQDLAGYERFQLILERFINVRSTLRQ